MTKNIPLYAKDASKLKQTRIRKINISEVNQYAKTCNLHGNIRAYQQGENKETRCNLHHMVT